MTCLSKVVSRSVPQVSAPAARAGFSSRLPPIDPWSLQMQQSAAPAETAMEHVLKSLAPPTFSWRIQNTQTSVVMRPERVLMAGFSGRNRNLVQAHIDELVAHGVPAPKQTPALYCTPVRNLTQNIRIKVDSKHTTGEAEAVLILHRGTIFVTVGSDHTDRELEKIDIETSKQLPKIVSDECWHFDDLRRRSDNLRLSSSVGNSSPDSLYQNGLLSYFLKPNELLRFIASKHKNLDGSVIFCGTLPLLNGKFTPTRFFKAELQDPTTAQSLSLTYETT
jgi:hypothetical protein